MYVWLLVILPVIGEAAWDCQYDESMQYKYNYRVELMNTVPERLRTPYNNHGVSLSGSVSLIPLKKQEGFFYIEVYIEEVLQHNIESVYSHYIDHQRLSAFFYIESDTLHLPKDQTDHGSNILRGLISAIKVKTCTQTRSFTTQEVTVVGTHSTSYEGRSVNEALMLDDPNRGEGWEGHVSGDMELSRRVGDTDHALFTGNTAYLHKQFLARILKDGTHRTYDYIMGSDIITSCVVNEVFSPRHAPGYSSSSDLVIRSSLELVSVEMDPDSLYQFSLSEIRDLKLYGVQLKEQSIVMQLSIPDLRPPSLFKEAAAQLRSLLRTGYEHTSEPVIRAWLDLVRHIYVGISSPEGKEVFEVADDSESLAWFIDAASVNGTAQLHLMIHNAIKLSRADELTERFIASKQFTADPPLRMLRWLLRTCNIDRYSDVCTLAIGTSATNFYNANQDRLSIVDAIMSHIRENVEQARDLEEKLFYIAALGNVKLPEAARYLINIVFSDSEPDVRKEALLTLQYQKHTDISYQERHELLTLALSRNTVDGAAIVFYIFSTARHQSLPVLVQLAVREICNVEAHPLASFLHQTLSTLRQSFTDPVRASIINEEVKQLHYSCRYCLPSAPANSSSQLVTSSFLFGSPVLGGEVRYQRFADQLMTPDSGVTTLSLNFLQYYGISPDILKTSFRWESSDSSGGGSSGGAGTMNVVVNQERVKYATFQADKEATTHANILLSDITHVLPSTCGLPLAYTITGTLRSESTASYSDNTINLKNKLGMYMDTGFRFNGARTGWLTGTVFQTSYNDMYDMTNSEMKRHTYLEALTFRTDTTLESEISKRTENVNFNRGMRMMDTTVAVQANPTLPHFNVRGCQELVQGVILNLGPSTFPLDSKSYLGQWISAMPHVDESLVYEGSGYKCGEPNIFEGMQIHDSAAGRLSQTETRLVINVQSLYGIFAVGEHSRITTFVDGDAQRTARLEGAISDLTDILKRLQYYPLTGYAGPELITVTYREQGNQASLSWVALTFYVNSFCS